MHHPIALIVSDLDGCLLPANGGPWPLPQLACVARHNASIRETALPPVTVCTGRPIPFVDALLRAIAGELPAVCENGAALYSPVTRKHELLVSSEEALLMRRVHSILDRFVLRNGGIVEPGKLVCVSLLPPPGTPVPALAQSVSGQLETELGPGWHDAVSLTYSSAAVDLTPAGCDKYLGLNRLTEVLQIQPDAIAGVGDAPNDLPWLGFCGWKAAPANAFDEIKAIVDYVSPFAETEGVLDIMASLGALRRPEAAATRDDS